MIRCDRMIFFVAPHSISANANTPGHQFIHNMRVIIGGTFSPLHDGHKALITQAFTLAGPDGSVLIGLTTDSFAGRKYHPITPFEERLAKLTSYISESGWAAGYHIEPLSDRYGPSIDSDYDIIVVSDETYPVAREINRIRIERGLKTVDICRISCVLASDGRVISSTRILRGEIDEHGRCLSDN